MNAKWNDNLSYKFVAMGVALILWFSMLSRKDSTLVRELELQLILDSNVEIVGTVPEIVKVELAGPRVALKKVNQLNPIFTLDLTGEKPGRLVKQLNRDGLALPIGTRILSMEPASVVLELRSAKGESK